MQRMLHLSTNHIMRADIVRLDERNLHEFPLTVYDKGECGWFIPITDDLDDEKKQRQILVYLTETFLNVLKYAKAKGANWIMLDRVGDLIEDLPVF